MNAFRDVSGAWIVLVAMLVLLVAIPFDAWLHTFVFRHLVNHEVRLVANGLNGLGTAWAGGGVLVTLVMSGRAAGDLEFAAAGVAGLIAVAAASLAVHTVKQVVCRGRPGLFEGWGVDGAGVGSEPAARRGERRAAALRFFHWPCIGDSRYHSFPSGHGAVVFAIAATLARVVPTRLLALVLGASGAALSRLVLNAHFLSDILAAGMIGWGIGQVVGTLLGPLALRWIAGAATQAGSRARLTETAPLTRAGPEGPDPERGVTP